MDDILADLRTARALWSEQHYEECHSFYEHLHGKYPHDHRAYCEEGLALYAEAEDYDKAISLLEHALTLRNDNIVAMLGLGELYSLMRGDDAKLAGAMSYFREVLAVASDNVTAKSIAFINMGELLTDHQDRLTAFKNATLIDSSNEIAHWSVATQLWINGNFEDALEEWKVVEYLEINKARDTRITKQYMAMVTHHEKARHYSFMLTSIIGPWLDGAIDTWNQAT